MTPKRKSTAPAEKRKTKLEARPGKKVSRKRTRPRTRASSKNLQALKRITPTIKGNTQDNPRPTIGIDPLLGDLPSVTLRDTAEVFFHFSRVDPRLADAWQRDVVMHEGPITLRRVMSPANFGGATPYAYVDRRLLWYLKHDPSDPLGARWDGYLANLCDAPPGAVTIVVGRNLVVQKTPPQICTGSES